MNKGGSVFKLPSISILAIKGNVSRDKYYF